MGSCRDREVRDASSAVRACSRWPFDVLCAAALRAWRYFLPPADSQDQNEPAQRVLAYCLGMSVWVTISAVIYQLLGVQPAVEILFVAAWPLAAIPFMLRSGQSPMLCGNLLLALVLSVYTALALVTGGPAAPVAPWFVALPIIAFFVTGARWGMLWTLLALLTASGLFAARELGVIFPTPFNASDLQVLQGAALMRLLLFVAGLMLVFRAIDLRQRAALNAAMLAAQAADRAKGEFLANMSHEIRTPLTAILGYTELLRDARWNPVEAAPVGRGDALETIHRNGEHLLQVINDILDLSKIEAGRLDLELGFASPRQTVADVLTLFAARAGAKELRLESRGHGELPDAIETDPTRLRQVLANLVGNAVKFTETGEVCVDVKWLGPPAGPGRIEFAIRDSGIGMTQQELSRLFQPFSQADGSTSRRYGGTGLGLAICRRLVQMMGGTIEVTSELEQGSCFKVSLPIVRTRLRNTDAATRGSDDDAAPRDKMVSRQAIDSCLAGYRILLAEDCADNQRLIRYLLQSAGTEVAVADNGQAAVLLALEELRQDSAFDLILMDMQMPILDGYEATSRLRAAGYRQPIIALTAHALSAEHDKCRAAGCDEVCTKPIERAAFFAAIRRQVSQREDEAVVAGSLSTML